MRRNSLAVIFGLISCLIIVQNSHAQTANSVVQKQHMYLERLLSFFEIDDGVTDPWLVRVSPLDPDWMSWLVRTGEMPPDFSTMPTIPSIPDPLIIDQGGKEIPIENMGQWIQHKEWIGQQVQHWITGTMPPPPENLKVEIISDNRKNEVTRRQVKLSFGPDQKGTLSIELLIPPGKGPFPVFLTQNDHESWGHVAVRRGYIACIYAGGDSKDDADAWAKLYYPEYDFGLLMRRAWGAHRAVDYLYTLPEVDKTKIGIAGHSRNGKQSLMAAAFDERITACIPSSSGTGGEIPFRYASEEYTVETIKVLTGRTSAWFSPRLRFFVGNEYKLPIDQNFLMALVAPRHLMISTAYTEEYGNPWGAQQMYQSVKKVYEFLGADDNLSIQLRIGGHGTLPFIIEEYFDFFDYAFGKKNIPSPPKDLLWNYSFEKWMKLSGEMINPLDFPERSIEDMLRTKQGLKINTVKDWESQKENLLKSICWSLGEEPELISDKSSLKFSSLDDDQDYLDDIIGRPLESANMGRKVISGIGELGQGFLYYPKDKVQRSEKLPVCIFLHEYSYSSGFQPTWPFTSAFSIEALVSKGIAVFAFDLIGMGSKIEEGTRFYQRYPHWSKLGKMVSDVKDAVSVLEGLDVIDPEHIYVAGYSLGGTVSLYSAALDNRIKGVAAFGAFTPLRLATSEKHLPGIQEFSHIHGLQPRLGFFVGQENRLPFDFNEIIGCIAPRNLLLVSPRYDQDASLEDIRLCISKAKVVYDLYGNEKAIDFQVPDYYNQFTEKQFAELLNWLVRNTE